MTKKGIIIIAMLLAAVAARAFDFSAAATSGQTIYYSIIGGTNVKVVSPDWDSHAQPTGFLTLSATVQHNGVTYHLTAIDAQAFRGCSGLTGISIPEGVTSLGRMAFAYCSSLDSIVLPTTLMEIGSMAFTGTAYFGNNTHINDDGLMFIGPYVIASLPNISTNIVLPEGTLGLGNMAFYSCGQMPRISLPASLRFIGENAFGNCFALSVVSLHSSTPPTLQANSFLDVPNPTASVPCGRGDNYRTAENWSAINIIERCDTGSVPPPLIGGGEHPILPGFPEDPVPAPSIQEPTPEVGIDDLEPETRFAATAVEGGLLIVLPNGENCTVRDVLGHTVATLQHTGFVPLRSAGLYLVGCPALNKTIKVIYNR